MGSIPKEIELMEQIANRVEKYIYKALYKPLEVCKEELLPWACYLSTVKSLRGIDTVLDFLRYHKPDLAGPIEKTYHELMIFATASDQKCEFHTFDVAESAKSTLKTCEDFLKKAEAQGTIDAAKIQICQDLELQSKNLASKLRHIAKMARAENSAGTGQNGTLAKPKRECWLWRLYEITLKVIVDAVLKMLRQG